MKTRIGLLVVLLAAGLLSPAFAEDEKEQDKQNDSPMKAETFKGLKLRSIGPALMSGRIADIAVHPKRQSTWYVAVGSGSVWKTTERGHHVEDDLRRSGVVLDRLCHDSIRAIPEIVWVGSGRKRGRPPRGLRRRRLQAASTAARPGRTSG